MKLNSPLIVAAHSSNPEMIRFLVSSGANVNAVNRLGTTALCVSSEKHLFDNCKTLLDAGANVNHVTPSGQFHLIFCAINGVNQSALRLLNLLLEHGAKVDLADKTGRSALHIAAANGNIEFCDTLLAHGASLDAKDAKGRTALFKCVKKYNFVLGLKLLSSGADPFSIKPLLTKSFQNDWPEFSKTACAFIAAKTARQAVDEISVSKLALQKK